MPEIEDFAEWLRMDIADYLQELRISNNPEEEVDNDLAQFKMDCGYWDSDVEHIKEYLKSYVESLFQTQVERLSSQSRDAEMEFTPTPSTYWKDEPSWKATKVFFTEDASIPTREQYVREPLANAVRILMVETGYIDLALTSKVHAAWLQVSTLSIKGRPKLKVGMLLVDLQSGAVDCNVYGCKAKFQLSEATLKNGDWDREWAEYQILRMFQHLGSHDHPRNPWPKFIRTPHYTQDSYEEKIANRVLTLSRQKTRSK